MRQKSETTFEVYLLQVKLTVKKGEQIAHGGNTGSPEDHILHFENPDSLDRAMEPFYYFWFPEIKDRTSSTPQKISHS